MELKPIRDRFNFKKTVKPKQKTLNPKRKKDRRGGKNGNEKQWNDRFIQMAFPLAKTGLIDKQIADVFGVSVKTLNRWKKLHPEFESALKNGKIFANENVVEALYKRATGYSHPETHISVYQGKVIKTPLTKHYAPDTTACIFWLKNRQPNDWKDRSENVLQNPDGSALEPITVKVVGGIVPKAKAKNEEEFKG